MKIQQGQQGTNHPFREQSQIYCTRLVGKLQTSVTLLPSVTCFSWSKTGRVVTLLWESLILFHCTASSGGGLGQFLVQINQLNIERGKKEMQPLTCQALCCQLNWKQQAIAFGHSQPDVLDEQLLNLAHHPGYESYWWLDEESLVMYKTFLADGTNCHKSPRFCQCLREEVRQLVANFVNILKKRAPCAFRLERAFSDPGVLPIISSTFCHQLQNWRSLQPNLLHWPYATK